MDCSGVVGEGRRPRVDVILNCKQPHCHMTAQGGAVVIIFCDGCVINSTQGCGTDDESRKASVSVEDEKKLELSSFKLHSSFRHFLYLKILSAGIYPAHLATEA